MLEAKLAAYRPLLLSVPPLGAGEGLLLVTATVPGRVALVGRLAVEMGLGDRVVAAAHDDAKVAVHGLCARPPFAPPAGAARTAREAEPPMWEPL